MNKLSALDNMMCILTLDVNTEARERLPFSKCSLLLSQNEQITKG